MKRSGYFITFLVTFTCIFAISAEVCATQVFGNLDAQVGVNSVFSVSTSSPSLNFGNIDPDPGGTTTDPPQNLYLFCNTNDNNEWELSISVLSPLTSGGDTIPNENFHFWGWGGNGAWDLGPGHLETVPHIFYTANTSEYITPFPAPLSFTLQFNVDISGGQPAGVYTTSIVLKMRDKVTSKEIEEIAYVTLGVNPSFSISVTPSSLNFSQTDPGITTETKELYVACSTNNNNSWSVNLKVISELTSGSYTIPNANFHWSQGSLVGGGTWDTTKNYVDTIPHPFYSSGPGEEITTLPVELILEFSVDVPAAQVAGTYITTLILTMTE